MNKRHAILILLLFALSSCFQSQRALEKYSVKYERTACYGTCPIYELTIYRNGDAKFNGKRNTDKLGLWQKQFEKRETKELFKSLKKANLNQYDSLYPTMYSDLPSTILTVTIKNKVKRIEITGEHPVQLDVYTKVLKEMASSANWNNSNLK